MSTEYFILVNNVMDDIDYPFCLLEACYKRVDIGLRSSGNKFIVYGNKDLGVVDYSSFCSMVNDNYWMIFDEDGNIVYPNEVFDIVDNYSCNPAQGLGKDLNEVELVEGSWGRQYASD